MAQGRGRHRRWRGCPMCKPHKNDANGDPERRTVGENVQMGSPRRWQRNDVPEDDPPLPRQSRKKDTKRWCKGKVGREHVPVIVKSTYYSITAEKKCGWRVSYIITSLTKPAKGTEKVWKCFHIHVCDNCGKHLDSYQSWYAGIGEECPDWQAYQKRQAALKQYAYTSQRPIKRHHSV